MFQFDTLISCNNVCESYYILVFSVTAKLEVVSRMNKTFRVRCTSTGGRVLNMSVTGSEFNSDLTNIQAVGTLKRKGNDIYTATTGTIKKGITEELYDCTASNGVSSHTGSVGLKGACIFLLSLGSNVFACASVYIYVCVICSCITCSLSIILVCVFENSMLIQAIYMCVSCFIHYVLCIPPYS